MLTERRVKEFFRGIYWIVVDGNAMLLRSCAIGRSRAFDLAACIDSDWEKV